MNLDMSRVIDKIKKLEKQFNLSQDPTERYALIMALDHIAEHDVPVPDFMRETYRKAMLHDHGVDDR